VFFFLLTSAIFTGDWYSPIVSSVALSQDVPESPTSVIRVQDSKNFRIGDWIVITSDVTSDVSLLI